MFSGLQNNIRLSFWTANIVVSQVNENYFGTKHFDTSEINNNTSNKETSLSTLNNTNK